MRNGPDFKGVQDHQITPTATLWRDTRPLWRQILDGSKSRQAAMLMLASAALTPVFLHEWTYVSAVFGVLAWRWRLSACKYGHLPFRMPCESGKVDYNDPKPGRTGFAKAQGVFMLGNLFGSDRSELWLGRRDMLTHMLAFGTTGSGKTEFLVSMAFNALAMGSGMFYVDPKASPKLTAQIYTMCRLVGREDDFRLINFMPRATDKPTPVRTTNTTNPFTYGNAESLSEILIALIPPSEGGNAIFSQKGMSLMRSLMRILVEMRNRGEIQLSVRTIRDHISLSKVVALCERDDFSPANTASIRAFMESVGWQKGQPLDKQPRSLPEQFSYAQSYFNQPLNSLTDTYGHIYNTDVGEVDMMDVVLNRRILVIPIPSLKMSVEELKNLGKICLSSIRMAIAVGLGEGKEGSFADILEALPTDAPAPFLSITDEYAAIPAPGYVEVLTQGRGLGIAAIVASQDYAGITKADKEGAEQLLANSKIKIALKLTVADATWDMLEKLAGKKDVMETSGSAVKPEVGMTLDYLDTMNTTVKERGRIRLEDLSKQIEGEFHAFFEDTVVRGQAFFANPPLKGSHQLRVPQLPHASRPDTKAVEARDGEAAALYAKLLRIAGQEDGEGGDVLEEAKAMEAALADRFRNEAPASVLALAEAFLNNGEAEPTETRRAMEALASVAGIGPTGESREPFELLSPLAPHPADDGLPDWPGDIGEIGEDGEELEWEALPQAIEEKGVLGGAVKAVATALGRREEEAEREADAAEEAVAVGRPGEPLQAWQDQAEAWQDQAGHAGGRLARSSKAKSLAAALDNLRRQAEKAGMGRGKAK
jgi:intracellular multiplication protein IcmO